MSNAEGLAKVYEGALRAYVAGAGEEELQHAYELGRTAMAAGLGILEVAAMHGRAVATLLRETGSLETVERASAFLVESLSPFEMSFRGIKEAHEHIVLLNARLERQNRELAFQNDRANEASIAKSRFLASMSHELRTPLNAIIGFATLLFDGSVDPSSPEHKEFLGDVLQSGKHLLGLIDDVLDLAKVEAGRLVFRPENVDLGDLIRDVQAVLRAESATKGVAIVVDVDPSLSSLHVDPSRLKQVLYNFLTNALKFSVRGTTVTVRGRPESGDKFRVEVEDHGVGIATRDLDKLFKEFGQLEPGRKTEHRGTGLGLALSRSIVEAQGGKVGVTSVLGEGSTFYAILPRRPEPK